MNPISKLALLVAMPLLLMRFSSASELSHPIPVLQQRTDHLNWTAPTTQLWPVPMVIPRPATGPSGQDCCLDWALQIGGADQDISHSIAVDGNGFVYTTGYFRGTTDFNPGPGVFNLTAAGQRDVFVTKMGPGGNLVWAVQLGGVADDEGRGIAVGPSGSVYLTGYYNPSGIGQPDAFVAKLDASGNLQWLTPVASSNIDWGNSVALDAAEEVYATGFFSNTVNLTAAITLVSAGGIDVFVTKMSGANGAVSWARQIGSTSSDAGNGIVLDAAGNVLVTGIFEGAVDFDPSAGTTLLTSAGSQDIFVTKLTPAGALDWARRAGGPLNDNAAAIATDAAGEVYITGDFQQTATFCTPVQSFTSGGLLDIVVWKLDANGTCVWVKQMGGSASPSADRGLSVAVDGAGNVLTTGHFREPTDFDPGPLAFVLTPAGGDDVYLSKLDAQGNFMWAKQMGGTGNDFGYDLALDTMGCIYVTGPFSTTGDFDPGPAVVNLTSAGAGEVFVVKLCACAGCCDDFDDFCDRVDLGWQVSIDSVNCMVTVTAPQFDSCHWFLTDGPVWGDGTPPSGGLTATTGSWTHTYTQSGIYSICVVVAEGDGMNFCWQKEMCTRIILNCCADSVAVVVADTVVCRNDPFAYVSVNCPDTCGITQISWFIKPCTAATWPTVPYQVSAGPNCANLLLLPNLYPGEPCVEVYAALTLDGSCCGITQLTSAPATVTLCDPVSCAINDPNPTGGFCQNGDPLPLTASYQPNVCPATVQWFYQGQLLAGETSLTYDPPPVAYQPGGPSDCYFDHTYTVVITGPCGPSSCSATVRVYNDNAPLGAITMNPFESQPFCPGEDATLEYRDSCTGEPPRWTWHSSLIDPPVIANGDYTQIPGSGTMNPKINTNRLYQTTWFAVNKQNGVCPEDWIEFRIEVKDPLAITFFNAVADPCVDTYVDLSVHFTPPQAAAGCSYVVEWYYNGQLIWTDLVNSSPVFYTYPSPTPGQGSMAGNYYAVVRDNCCANEVVQSQVITVAPTCYPDIMGPCNRYDNQQVVLTAEMVLPPDLPCPDISGCTWQWYQVLNGQLVLLSGEINQMYFPPAVGTFVVESNCNGCVRQSPPFTVNQCRNCMLVGVDDPNPLDAWQVEVYPNPTTGQLNLVLGTRAWQNARVEVLDIHGRVWHGEQIAGGAAVHQLQVGELPAGLYFLRISENHIPVWITKVIRN